MASPDAPIDLLDLKMLPAWATEPARPNEYANFEGEQAPGPSSFRDRRERERSRRPRPPRDREQRPPRGPQGPERRDRRPEFRQSRPPLSERPQMQLPQVEVRFLPEERVATHVIAQIKSESFAYSVFALARLFLDRPERYVVGLTSKAEQPLFQLGEHGPVAADRRILESRAFTAMQDEFFNIETTQTDPVKGNFTNVARCRLSGTLLGPTNYHSYQPQLRSLYEQRFSRRMSFADYQRQIEVVSDPAVVEQWKEQARSVTTYTTKSDDPPLRFNNAAEAERHFRSHYLPTLVRTVNEARIDGVLSRRLPDRALGRVIEEAWVQETRSPSRMMQELATLVRPASLTVFRHRRGMLFVTPIRPRPINEDGVSDSVRRVIEAIKASPRATRKDLADKLIASDGATAEEIEKAKLALAADLRWLINEGHLIEFNDGSLDLPRAKVKPVEKANEPAADEAGPMVESSADVLPPDEAAPVASEPEKMAKQSANGAN